MIRLWPTHFWRHRQSPFFNKLTQVEMSRSKPQQLDHQATQAQREIMDIKRYIFQYCPVCDQTITAAGLKKHFDCNKCGAPLEFGRSWPRTIGYGVLAFVILALIPAGGRVLPRSLGGAIAIAFFAGRIPEKRKDT